MSGGYCEGCGASVYAADASDEDVVADGVDSAVDCVADVVGGKYVYASVS